MTADQMRAEFERWADPRGFDLKKVRGQYFDVKTEHAEMTWQAGHASVAPSEQDVQEAVRLAGSLDHFAGAREFMMRPRNKRIDADLKAAAALLLKLAGREKP